MPDDLSSLPNLAEEWHVYIVECRDGSYYTGITTDIDRRVREHNSSPQGARYTRSRRPVILRYRECAASRSEALKRELQIKQLTSKNKRLLVTRSSETST